MRFAALIASYFRRKVCAGRPPSRGDVEHVGVQAAPAPLQIPTKQMKGGIGDHVLLPSVLPHWVCFFPSAVLPYFSEGSLVC